eukprot:gene19071-27010_t
MLLQLGTNRVDEAMPALKAFLADVQAAETANPGLGAYQTGIELFGNNADDLEAQTLLAQLANNSELYPQAVGHMENVLRKSPQERFYVLMAQFMEKRDGNLDAGLGWYWLGLMLAVALGRGVLQYIASVLSLVISQELLTRLRSRILAQVQSLHLGYHWQHGMGEMITRTTRDADKVRDALITFWRQLVETPLVVLATVGLLSWYNPLLGLVPLLLTVTGLAIFVRQTEQLVSLDRAVGSAYDRVNQDLSEGIGGVRVIKSFALEQRRIQGFADQVAVFAALARQALAYSSSRIPLPQAVV